jgi:hypothetical protein
VHYLLDQELQSGDLQYLHSEPEGLAQQKLSCYRADQ